MHSLIWRQRDLQAHSKSHLVGIGACHAHIMRDEKASKVLDRAGDGKSIRGSRCGFVEEEIEFRAYRQPEALSNTG